MGLADRDYYGEKFWKLMEEKENKKRKKKFVLIALILLAILFVSLIFSLLK